MFLFFSCLTYFIATVKLIAILQSPRALIAYSKRVTIQTPLAYFEGQQKPAPSAAADIAIGHDFDIDSGCGCVVGCGAGTTCISIKGYRKHFERKNTHCSLAQSVVPRPDAPTPASPARPRIPPERQAVEKACLHFDWSRDQGLRADLRRGVGGRCEGVARHHGSGHAHTSIHFVYVAWLHFIKAPANAKNKLRSASPF